MEAVFLRILQMSGTASVVIFAVIVLRALLKKAPKKLSYLLWSAAAFRLCCPVSFRAMFSLFRLEKPMRQAVTAAAQAVRIAPAVPVQSPLQYKDVGANLTIPYLPVSPAPAVDSPLPLSAAEPLTSVQLLTRVGTILWLAGLACMAVYAVFSFLRLKNDLSAAVRLEGNVWQSDRIRSPFILGVFRPRIYIPFGMDGVRMDYVLAHERYHITHLDHLVKPFAFALLAVHWFNPLVWLAFVLMGRDMEMRCDEAVLSQMGGGRKAYSMTLLTFAAPKCFPAPSPLAFGESGVRQRIRNALRWKKPRLWVTLTVLAVCIFAVAACSANPKEADKSSVSEALSTEEDACYLTEEPENMAKIRSILLSDSSLRELNRAQLDGKLFLSYLSNFSMDRDYARFTLSRDPSGADGIWRFRAFLSEDASQKQMPTGARDEFALSSDTAASLLPYLREWTEDDFLPLWVTLNAQSPVIIHDAATVARLYAGLPELGDPTEISQKEALAQLGTIYNTAITAVFYDLPSSHTKEYTLWRTTADTYCRIKDEDGLAHYFRLKNRSSQAQRFYDAYVLQQSLGNGTPYPFGGANAKGHSVPTEFWISSPVSSQFTTEAVTDPAGKAELYGTYHGIRVLREVPPEDRASVDERQSGFLTVDFRDNGEDVSLWMGRKMLVVWNGDHTDYTWYEMENGEEVYAVFHKYYDLLVERTQAKYGFPTVEPTFVSHLFSVGEQEVFRMDFPYLWEENAEMEASFVPQADGANDYLYRFSLKPTPIAKPADLRPVLFQLELTPVSHRPEGWPSLPVGKTLYTLTLPDGRTFDLSYHPASDVQWTPETEALYLAMMDQAPQILESISFSDGVTPTAVD